METTETVTDHYLDDNGEPIVADSSVKLPKGYSLLSAPKKSSNPKKQISDLNKEAEKRKPPVVPAGYILSPLTRTLTASPSLPDLSIPADNKEGLYEMYGRTGQGGVLGSFQVPYSKVQAALSSGATFHNGSDSVYAKDKEAEGKKNYWYQNILQSPALAPVENETPVQISKNWGFGNKERAVARTILGTPQYVKELIDAAKEMHEGSVAGGDKFANLINAYQLPKQLYDQYRADRKLYSKDPTIAWDNLVGNLVGLGAVGLATHGVSHVAGKGLSVLKDHVSPADKPPVRSRTNVIHRNGAGEVRQAKGQATTVWLSPSAWESLFKVMYPDENHEYNNGFNIPKPVLEAVSNHPDLASYHPEIQSLLDKANKFSENNGAALASKSGKGIQHAVRVMREELIHTKQRQLAANGAFEDVLRPGVFSHLNRNIPQGMYDHLLDNGYDEYNSPQMVTEAAAKLMGRKSIEFGVTPEEKAKLLTEYFSEIAAHHGKESLDVFTHLVDGAKEAKEKAYAEHTGKENTATDAGLGNKGTNGSPLQSMAGGRGSGTPEIHQGAGSEKGGVNDNQLGTTQGRGVPGMEGGGQGSLAAPAEAVEDRGQAAVDTSTAGRIGSNVVLPGGAVSPTISRAADGGKGAVETGAGQYSATVSGVGDGGQGGAEEGVQTGGEQVAPAAEPLFNREQEKPIWYLKSERLIGEKMPGPMPAQYVSKMLIAGGVKPEEMHWTGLEDFLKSKGNEKVTPQEIKDHLAENNLQIREVTKGDNLSDEEEKRYYALLGDSFHINEAERKEFNSLSQRVSQSSPTMYGSYVLPGGESYREMLITAPSIGESPESKALTYFRDKMDAKYDGSPYGNLTPDEQEELTRLTTANDAARPSTNYQSSHWEEPNILAHVRFNDRIGSNGEKLLHLEEIQSDLPQTARKKGYQDPAKQDELLAKSKTAKDELQAADKEVEDLRNDLLYDELHGNPAAIEDAKAKLRKAMGKRSLANDNLRAAQEELRQSFKGVPNAPWKKNWHEQVLRRMIRHAVDNNYAGVSWTGGEDQADRYSLAKQISRLEYLPVDGTLNAFDHSGSRVMREVVTPEELPDYIGKEAANKLLQTPRIDTDTMKEGDETTVEYQGKQRRVKLHPDRRLNEGKNSESVMVTGIDDGREMRWFVPLYELESHTIANADLKVGGEGMKGFYDKIVPEYLNKFGKRYGAKVETTEIPVTDGWAGNKKGITASITDDARFGKMDLWATVDSGGNWTGITGDPEAVLMPGEKIVHVADRTGKLTPAVKELEMAKPQGKTVQYLPITPEMRQSVGEEGTPLFNREQVKTPEFKKWFGESAVVDENGEPLVVYKAMYPYDWTEEKPWRINYPKGRLLDQINSPTEFPSFNDDEPGVKIAVFFGDKNIANIFAEHIDEPAIYPTYLSIQNPFVIDADGRDAYDVQFKKEGKEFRDAIRSGKYDGVIIKNTSDEGTIYVALKPEQIKSAIGNSGAFDPKDPSILRNREKAPDADTLDVKRSRSLKDTINALDPYGHRMDDIYGEEDWQEMTEDARRDAIDASYDEAEREEEEEAERTYKRKMLDEEIERKGKFVDDNLEKVESLLKAYGIPFQTKGSRGFSKYVSIDLPNDESATIRVSDHEPPLGRGGMMKGGTDYYDAADVSIHPGSESLDSLRKLLKDHEVKESAHTYVADIDNATKEYNAANTDGGTVKVSLDRAREMLPEYQTPEDRTKNHSSLGEPATKIRDAAWQQALAKGPTGNRDVVAFLAGSPGAGKTSGDMASDKIAIVSEGMIGTFESSAKSIQEAIDAGFKPVLQLVTVDDPKVTLRRAVGRAMEHGRPVTVKMMAKLYAGLPSVVEQLKSKFGDNLVIDVIDNSVNGRSAQESTLEDALSKQGAYNEDEAREEMLDELDRLYDAGAVSTSVYQAFRKGTNNKLRSREDSKGSIPESIRGETGEDKSRGESNGNLGIPDAQRIQIQGDTVLAGVPIMIPAVTPAKKVLSRQELMAQAAARNPNSQKKVSSVRELLEQARSRMVP